MSLNCLEECDIYLEASNQPKALVGCAEALRHPHTFGLSFCRGGVLLCVVHHPVRQLHNEVTHRQWVAPSGIEVGAEIGVGACGKECEGY